MKKSTRILLTISVVLMLAGTATCYFGERHVLNQLPADVRAHLENDSDWLAVEWIAGGMGLFLLGVCVGALPVTIYLARRLRFRWSRARA